MFQYSVGALQEDIVNSFEKKAKAQINEILWMEEYCHNKTILVTEEN